MEGISAVKKPDNSLAAPQLHPSPCTKSKLELIECADLSFCYLFDSLRGSGHQLGELILSGILVFVILILAFDNGCCMPTFQTKQTNKV